jgi:hypothetical protein
VFYLFLDVCCNHFLSRCCICCQTYVATTCSKCFNCFSLMLQCFFMSQLFYLDVAYIFTHMLRAYILNVSSISNVRYIRVFHIASADGVHKGGQGQAAAINVWRSCELPLAMWGGGTGCAVLSWKRRGRVFWEA